jgi:hypothetical protein
MACRGADFSSHDGGRLTKKLLNPSMGTKSSRLREVNNTCRSSTTWIIWNCYIVEPLETGSASTTVETPAALIT